MGNIFMKLQSKFFAFFLYIPSFTHKTEQWKLDPGVSVLWFLVCGNSSGRAQLTCAEWQGKVCVFAESSNTQSWDLTFCMAF